jgi:hypothetical protein
MLKHGYDSGFFLVADYTLSVMAGRSRFSGLARGPAMTGWAKTEDRIPLDALICGRRLSYLHAMTRAGTDAAQQVMNTTTAMTVSDVFAQNGHVRADGKMIFDRYLAHVKTPAESNDEWELLTILSTIPGADGFRRLSKSECPLVKS